MASQLGRPSTGRVVRRFSPSFRHSVGVGEAAGCGLLLAMRRIYTVGETREIRSGDRPGVRRPFRRRRITTMAPRLGADYVDAPLWEAKATLAKLRAEREKKRNG